MDANWIATSQSYLVTSALLLIALATARASLWQLLVMFFGVATSVVWIVQICLWRDLEAADRVPILVLASIFAAGWTIPLLGVTSWHVWRWLRRR